MKAAQHPRAISFQNIISDFGLSHQVLEFEESTHSAQDAADAIGCKLGQIVKSIVFKGTQSGNPIVVLTCGDNLVDIEKIRKIANEDLEKANAEFVRESTGYSIGGVPPFGHTSAFHIYFDEDFMKYELLWAAAGTPNAVFPISPLELKQITKAEEANIRIED